MTNRSTRGGAPVAAMLRVRYSGVAGGTVLTFTPPGPFYVEFGAGAGRTYDAIFTVPLGTGGMTGIIQAFVDDPAHNNIAYAEEPLIIQAAGPLIILSTDSWEEYSLWPGEFRGETIAAGYTTVGGLGRAFIVFPALPSFTRVVLNMVIQSVWPLGATQTNRFRIGGTTIFTDSAIASGPISVDITEFVSPGTPFTVIIEPSNLAATVQYYHAYWSHIIPYGYADGEVRPLLEVTVPRAVFYPTDNWEQIAPDTRYRGELVACGWTWYAGSLVRVDSHFLFPMMPTDITRATLRLFLRSKFGTPPTTEFRDPYWGLLGTENNVPPATISLDVTAAVRARGTLWVVGNPAVFTGVSTFRYYGSIYDGDPARTYWARVEIE